MSTSTTAPPGPTVVKEEQPYIDSLEKRHTGPKLLGILVVWLIAWFFLRGRNTLQLDTQDTTPVQNWLQSIRTWIQTEGQSNWFFHGVLGTIGNVLDWLVQNLQFLLSTAAFPRPVPIIGWLGVVAIFAWASYALAGLRSCILVTVCLLAFGVLSLWQASMDTIIVTMVSVIICIIIGLPTGIMMARSGRVSAIITPILDLMQTMPAFAYLSAVALFFGIGPATAVVLTIIYALPPLVRITEHGLHQVSENTIEAGRSLGVSRLQLLRQIQLPMAKRTIVVGINQSMMAALSMTVIASLVNGPGLGSNVTTALQVLNVGQASVAGLAIVLIAIMLDRTTTAASERSEAARAAESRAPSRRTAAVDRTLALLPGWATESGGHGAGRLRVTGAGRRLVLGLLAVPAVVAVYLSTIYLGLAQFPSVAGVPVLGFFDGAHLTQVINTVSNAVVSAVAGPAGAFKNIISYGFLNPLQSLLATSPWWVMAIVLLALAYVLGGWVPAAITVACEAVLLVVGLWNDAMVTLTMTIVATVLVMVVALIVGVAMGRSSAVETLIRPILDAFQTIPAFVYLVPALALFSPSRFTAIVAAVAYAVPIATKLVADGIRGVSATTVEAARSTGITRWQMIRKVQLPMSREALVLATNQGLLYVLSMVVIGGLVGGGSLGFLIVQGLDQTNLFGKGLAAGIAITALGIMIDRMARYAAARYGRA